MARSLGQLTVDLVANIGGFVQGMSKAEREAAKWKRQVQRDIESVVKTAKWGAVLIGGTLAAATLKLAKDGLNAVSAQNKLAKSLNTTYDSVTQLNKAFRDAGVENYEQGLMRLNRRLGASQLGRGAAMKSVKELGLDVKALLDMNAADRLATIADRVKAVSKNVQQAQWYMFELGFQQKEVAEMFLKGGDAIREAETYVQRMGLAMSDLDATKVEMAADSFADIGDGSKAASQHIALAFTPAIFAANNAILDLVEDMGGIEDVSDRLAQAGVDAFASMANAADGFRRVVMVVGQAVGGVAAAWDQVVTGGKRGFLGSLTSLSPSKLAMSLPGMLFGDEQDIKSDAKAAIQILKDAFGDMDETLFGDLLAGDSIRLRYKEEIANLDREARKALASRRDMISGWEEEAEAIEATSKTYIELKAGYDDAANALHRYNQEMADIAESTATAEQKTELVTLATKKYEDALKEIERRNENAKLAFLELKAKYDQGSSALLEYKKALDEINHAMITTEERTYLIAQAQKKYNEALDELREKSYWEKWLEGAEENFKSFDEMAGSTIENFTSGFGNAFESMLFEANNFGDGFKNMVIGMSRSIVNALGQMAAQWIAYQLVQRAVNNATATGAAAVVAGNAMAKSQEAALNAYSSTAAIPVVGPAMAPAAAATAKAATMPFASAAMAAIRGIMGMAHDGMDYVPQDGTWLLQKGERVVTAETSARLDRVLESIERGGPSRVGGMEVSLRLDSGLVMENLRNDDDFERTVVNIMNRNR